MLRFPNKPRRPKAKASEGRPSRSADDWHETLTRALITALAIFIVFQLLYALPGQCAVAAVGDRILIDAGSADDAGAPVLTATEAASGQTCRLDVGTMKHPGGVLTVLEASPDRVLLSWAGGATAPGAADCRRHEIAVTATDYVTLLNLGPQNINAR